MKDILISVSRDTRMVYLNKSFLGNDSENLQGNIVFTFKDEFVDGTARLEYEIDGEKHYAMLQKDGESYVIPVQNALTKEGQNNMQLVITEGTDENAIPVFKSNIFYIFVGSSINTCIEEPEEYQQWIEVANVKLNTIDKAVEEASNLDITTEKIDNVATIKVTRKSGAEEVVEIYDGEKGQDGIDGKNALINGKNTIEIKAGENTKIRQENNTLFIDSEACYDDTEIKQEINNLDIEVGGLTDNINEIVRTKADKSTTYTKDEVNELIGDIKGSHFEVVEVLPEIGEENVIYLIPKQNEEFDDVYYEYVWVNNQYELIGSTQIDLSNYYTKDELNAQNSPMAIKFINVGEQIINIDELPNNWYIFNGTIYNSTTGQSRKYSRKELIFKNSSTSYRMIYITDKTETGSIAIGFYQSKDGITYTNMDVKNIGDLNYLITQNKSNIVNAINEIASNPLGNITIGYGLNLGFDEEAQQMSIYTNNFVIPDLTNIDEAGIEFINGLIDAKIGDIDTILQNLDTGAGVE